MISQRAIRNITRLSRDHLAWLRQLARLLYHLLQRFFAQQCNAVASSLTFMTLLALVPLLSVALAAFTLLPAFAIYQAQFKAFILSNLVPDAAGKVLTVYLAQFLDNTDKMTLFGLGGLAATAISLIFTIEAVFNRIWGVSKPRPFFSRLLSYLALLILGPLLLGVTLSVNTFLFGQDSVLRTVPFVGLLVSYLGAFTVGILGFTLLYTIVPNYPVPVKHALIAAVFVVILLHGIHALLGWYIQHLTSYAFIYGAFASFPIFLVWLHIGWSLILLGALLSAVLTERKASR